jgi:hypothetical protein
MDPTPKTKNSESAASGPIFPKGPMKPGSASSRVREIPSIPPPTLSV